MKCPLCDSEMVIIEDVVYGCIKCDTDFTEDKVLGSDWKQSWIIKEQLKEEIEDMKMFGVKTRGFPDSLEMTYYYVGHDKALSEVIRLLKGDEE